MIDEIPLLNSDNDDIITIVKKELNDCVILGFTSGGTLTLPKSNYLEKNNFNKGDIVGLEFISENNPDERFRVRYLLPKERWQKNKIEKAFKEKKVIFGVVLYPFKDKGIFVNIYGKRALMLNDQISDSQRPQEGETIKVAVSSFESTGTQWKIIVSQKWAEKLSIQEADYDSIYEGDCLDTIIDKIEERFIKVKYAHLSCIIPRSNLFCCNVRNLNDHLEVGDPIRARVVSKKRENGKFNVCLSHLEFSLNPWENDTLFHEQGEVSGPITDKNENSITIKIAEGVEGILYANNMSRIEFEALKSWNAKKDDDVNVIIKSINKEKKRIELCVPTLEGIDEIWDNIHQYYEVDKSYKGKVISHEDDFLWVQLRKGIEASINKNEMRWRKCSSTKEETFKLGNPIKVLITHIDKSKRKIFASIKQLTPNPWMVAEASINPGDTCIVEVIDRKRDALIVETQDQFHLVGRINMSEISWFPLKQDEEPQQGQKFEAKVIVFQPEKYNLCLSVRQLQEDPWESLYLGAEVNGTIQSQTESTFIYVQLENNLLAKTSEAELYHKIGAKCSFKIISLNRTAEEIIVSHNSWTFDKKTEEIVKSFFKVL